tara:strand:- start:113 stop:553 length:441 start_codon:yes stop_codon:yes gene_type:complete
MIELYTIGFTKKNAKNFFNLLNINSVETIVDTRINNTSQLSGFAKADDLEFFAESIGGMNYKHIIDFAPTKELLSKYRKKEMTWEEYEVEYLNLLDMRKIKDTVSIDNLNKSCLLCSEHSPEFCHRRLLAEFFQHINKNVKIIHLE